MPAPLSGTYFESSNALVQKVWAKDTFVAALRKTVIFGNKDMVLYGSGPGNMVQEYDDLQKNAGDQITAAIVHQLAGAGVMGADILEGTHEGLNAKPFNFKINKYRHGVNVWGEITEQRIPWPVVKNAKDMLSDHLASRLETWAFTQLCGWTAPATSIYKDDGGTAIPGNDLRYTGMNTPTAPDAQHILRPGTLTTDQAVGADPTARADVDLLDDAVAQSVQIYPPLRTMKFKGRNLLIWWLHTNQVRSLRKTDSDWFGAIQRCLASSGLADVPPFNSALGMWNDVLIYGTPRISPGIDSGTGAGVANTRRSVLAGAQALVMAWGKDYGPNKVKWFNGTWDDGDKYRASYAICGGISAPFFDDGAGTNRDFGRMIITTYARDVV